MLSYVLDSMGDNPIAVVGANVPQVCSSNLSCKENYLVKDAD